MLTAATLAAIVAACWAHPSGVSYLEKIDQIEAAAIVCGNPCCIRGGDDAPMLKPKGKGWDEEAWRKRKAREDALERTIREQWLRLTGNEPAPEVVEQAKAEEIQREEAVSFISFTAWQTYQFTALQDVLQGLINQEQDDEETILLLL